MVRVEATSRHQDEKFAAFVHDAVDLELPLELVRQRLAEGTGWLVRVAHRATDEGEAVVVRLHPASATHLGVPARVLLGESRTVPSVEKVLVPLRWEARTFTGLFPVLDGNLELSPSGPGRCRLGLVASYRPPLGAVGGWLDNAALHRVAESTVHSFLRQVGDRLLTDGLGGASAR